MYKLQDLVVFIDLCTHCNAGCPQCHRTDPNGLGKVEWLPLIQWSLEEFKTAFPPKVLSCCKILNICGTWGDPIMNKNIHKIIHYVVDHSNCIISIDTNGSIRDEQWWWEIGMKAGRQLHVTFAVDGTTQEMHQKYRRFTNLQKVLNNMKALSETKAVPIASTIQFKHNQEYTQEIKDLCQRHGAKAYRIVQSDRFYINKETVLEDVDHFVDENGNADSLERATIDPPNPHISGTVGKSSLDQNISCRWQKENKVFVNIDGQVLPCCYIGNNYYTRKMDNNRFNKFGKHPVIKQYYDDQDQHNIFKHTLTEILGTSQWFQHMLPNSWNNPETAVRQCAKFCSALVRTKQQLKGYMND